MSCPQSWIAITAFIGLLTSILEYWLGKTEKVKSGSILELVFSAIMMIVLIIIRRFYAKSTSDDGSSKGI